MRTNEDKWEQMGTNGDKCKKGQMATQGDKWRQMETNGN